MKIAFNLSLTFGFLALAGNGCGGDADFHGILNAGPPSPATLKEAAPGSISSRNTGEPFRTLETVRAFGGSFAGNLTFKGTAQDKLAMGTDAPSMIPQAGVGGDRRSALTLPGISRTSICVEAQPLRPYRPAGIPADHPAYNSPNEPEFSAAELAVPPIGQIQKSHLRTVNQLRTLVAADLAALPAGAEGKESPWFAKAEAYKAGLDTVAASSLQADCFAVIPRIKNLLAARQDEYTEIAVPSFALQCAGLANGFSTVLMHAIERHIIDQNGTVSVPNLTSFCTVFSTAGFTAEGDWEGTPIPIDAAGIMILDATSVATELKTRPWEEADQFLGNRTSAVAFARYAASGDGLAILKTKYAADQAAITAKWEELAAWVETQRPQE